MDTQPKLIQLQSSFPKLAPARRRSPTCLLNPEEAALICHLHLAKIIIYYLFAFASFVKLSFDTPSICHSILNFSNRDLDATCNLVCTAAPLHLPLSADVAAGYFLPCEPGELKLNVACIDSCTLFVPCLYR